MSMSAMFILIAIQRNCLAASILFAMIIMTICLNFGAMMMQIGQAKILRLEMKTVYTFYSESRPLWAVASVREFYYWFSVVVNG